MAIHRDLADSELHEPKGVAGAAVNTLYIANGAGSGVWNPVSAGIISVSNPNYTASNLDDALTEIFTVFGLVDGRMTDVSTAGFILMPIPFSCRVVEIHFVLANAITTADSTLTITRSDGAAMGTQLIPFTGSAEGTTFDFTPATNDELTFPTHRYVKVATDGGSSTVSQLFCQMEIQRI